MIFIVGAGWYGCHIALELQKAGYEFRILDKSNTFFAGSSARNQNRLHLGYHYPRSPETIQECREGFAAFKATYPTLSHPIPNNLYLLSLGSRTSVSEFSQRMDHCGELLCVEGRTPFSKIRRVWPTMFEVAEEYIDNVAATEFFRTALEPYRIPMPSSSSTSSTSSGESIENINDMRRMLGAQKDDWMINCTYNHLDPIPMSHYELYCSLVYHIPGDLFALTLMDGPYFSIYPYDIERRLYTVTSVQHGVLWRGQGQGTKMLEAPADCEVVRRIVEAEVAETLPEFPTRATYHSSFVSWKTKPVTDADDRSLRFQVKDRTISLYGGKITGMFEAARRVLGILNHSKVET